MVSSAHRHAHRWRAGNFCSVQLTWDRWVQCASLPYRRADRRHFHCSIAALAPYALKSSIFFPSICLEDYVRMLEEVELSNANMNMARARAEASFKRKQEKAREGAKAWTEYEAQYRGVDQKIARLRALRLAKEAAEAAENND